MGPSTFTTVGGETDATEPLAECWVACGSPVTAGTEVTGGVDVDGVEDPGAGDGNVATDDVGEPGVGGTGRRGGAGGVVATAGRDMDGMFGISGRVETTGASDGMVSWVMALSSPLM